MTAPAMAPGLAPSLLVCRIAAVELDAAGGEKVDPCDGSEAADDEVTFSGATATSAGVKPLALLRGDDSYVVSANATYWVKRQNTRVGHRDPVQPERPVARGPKHDLVRRSRVEVAGKKDARRRVELVDCSDVGRSAVELDGEGGRACAVKRDLLTCGRVPLSAQ